MAFMGMVLAGIFIMVVLFFIAFLIGLILLIIAAVRGERSKKKEKSSRAKGNSVLIIIGSLLGLPFVITFAFCMYVYIPLEIENRNSVEYQIINGTNKDLDKLLKRKKSLDKDFKIKGLNTVCKERKINDREDKLKTLLKYDVDVNAVTKEGKTPLIYMCHYGNLKEEEKIEIAKILVENNADVNICDKNAHTALDYAYKDGHHKLVAFLKKTYINESEKSLAYNVKNKTAKDVEKVLKTGITTNCDMGVVDLNVEVDEREFTKTPLYYLGTTSNIVDRKEKIMLLCEYGADIDKEIGSTQISVNPDNSIKTHKETLLHEACKRTDAETVRILLECGAEADVYDLEDKTPLYYACDIPIKKEHTKQDILNQRKIVQMLIDKDADPYYRCNGLDTPIDIASFFDRTDFLKIINDTAK